DALRHLVPAPRLDARPGDHERDAYRLLVEVSAVGQVAVLMEFLAMVGRHHDDRRSEDAEAVEAAQELGQGIVPGAHLARVERAQMVELLRTRWTRAAPVDGVRQV